MSSRLVPRPTGGGAERLRPGTRAFRRALLGLFSVGLATFALLYAVQPLLAPIGTEFGVSAAEAALLVSLSTGALAVSVLPMARLSERLGRAQVILGCLTVATVAGAAVAAADTWVLMLALRTAQGVALAGVPAAALAWVTEHVHRPSITRVGGLYIAGTTVGGMVGRLLGGVVADLGDWRSGVLAVAVLGAVATAGAYALLPTGRGGGGAVQPRSGHPGPDVHRATRVRLYLVGGLGMAMFVGVFNVIGYRTSAEPYDLGPGLGSMFFLTYLAGTVSASLAGRVTARLGLRPALLAGLATCVAGLLVSLAGPLAVIWLGLLILSAGFFVTHAIATSGSARLAPRPSAASARYTLAYYLGSSVGGLLLGQAWEMGEWGGTVVAGAVLVAVATVAVAGLPQRPAR